MTPRRETLRHADELAEEFVEGDLPEQIVDAVRSDDLFLHLGSAYHHVKLADQEQDHHDLAARHSLRSRAEERLVEIAPIQEVEHVS